MASPNMTLKLLVDKKGQRVLFAEANKEFVDFLFHIFSLPHGTLIQFLGSNQMVGCLGKLKETIDSFNETYLKPGIGKDEILKRNTDFIGNMFSLRYDASFVDQSTLSKTLYGCLTAYLRSGSNCPKYVAEYEDDKCPYCSRWMNVSLSYVAPQWKKTRADNVSATSKTLYGCSSSTRKYVTECKDAVCPCCNDLMSVALTPVVPASMAAATKKRREKGGYVKEGVSYMVMDDLVVKPMSPISSITLISEFGIDDISRLEEKIVSFGRDEALKLLKASMATNEVLTTVFLHNNVAEIDLLSSEILPSSSPC